MSIADAYITGMTRRNLAFFGDSATYTDISSGVSQVVTVWKDEQLQNIISGYSTNVWEQIFTIEIMLADVIAEPDVGDTFQIGTNNYKVNAVMENDGVTCKMAVLKVATIGTGERNYVVPLISFSNESPITLTALNIGQTILIYNTSNTIINMPDITLCQLNVPIIITKKSATYLILKTNSNTVLFVSPYSNGNVLSEETTTINSTVTLIKTSETEWYVYAVGNWEFNTIVVT